MNTKSKRYKISLIFFYIALAVFVLSLIVVYSSSDESSEFVPSMRYITRFVFHWLILPICFLLSVIGCSLAAAAKGKIQYKHFILGLSLNLSMILAYGGYLWAYHSGFIYFWEMDSEYRIEYALDHNKLWLVKWELMKGADVDEEYLYNETLLMYSIRNYNKKLLKIVLAYHPDVNIYCNIQGKIETPLIHIADNKVHSSSEIVSKRIRKSMSLHQLKMQDSERRNYGSGILALSPNKPLPPPKNWNPTEVARLLLEHGADPDLRLKSSNPKRTYADITALSLAYENGKSDLVDLLLSYNADVNVKTEYHEQTLLHAAVEQGDAQMVRRLIKLGAELDVKDNDKYDGSKSPLQMAVAFENIECAKILIEDGADVNLMFSKGIGGNPPLHLAVMTGNMEMVQLLLNHGADVNTKEINGKTPLHLAVDFSRDKTEIVKLLLEHGANPDVSAVFSDNKGEKESLTPLSLAQKKQYSAVADVLLHYEVKI